MTPPPRTAALLLLPLLLLSQTPVQEVVVGSHPYTPPSAILRAEANLVEAALTVRDSQGRTVAGLHPTDFEVLDNGVPQKITAFSELRSDGKPASTTAKSSEAVPPANVPPPAPKYVTFFFDDLHTGNGGMAFVKKAAHAFIAKGLKPSDRMSIVTASGQGDLDFTDDAARFEAAIEHVSAHVRPVVPSYCGASAIDSYIFLHNLDGNIRDEVIAAAIPCAGCSAHDPPGLCKAKATGVAQQAANSAWDQMQAQSLETVAALGFAAKRLSDMKGTRILVLTSSGFLLRPGVQPELRTFIDGAVRLGVVVHAIAAQGLDSTPDFSTKDDLHRSLPLMSLENITAGTGGHYFKNTNDLAGAMDLAANPEVSYLLAFNPGARDGTFHTLKIRFPSKRPDSIQFRPGYFSPADTKKEPTARTPLDDAVFSRKTIVDLPVSVSVSRGEPKDGGIPVSIAIRLDVNHLGFAEANGRHMQQIVFLMALLDSEGSFVTGKEAIMELALSDEKLASLQQDGLKAVGTLTAPAGNYQVRAIVREGMKGSLAASTTPVELR
jgi:VWFA-related protein